MKYFLLIFALSTCALGADNYLSGALGFFAPGENLLVGTNNNGDQTSVSFTLSGFVGLGADFDHMLKRGVSVGGLFRIYTTSTTLVNNTVKNSLWALGPTIKGYLPVDDWTFYAGTGFALVAPTYTSTNARGDTTTVTINTTIGWLMSVGVFYRLTDSFSLGFENLRVIGLGAGINGVPVSDYMVKGRFAL